MTKSKDIKLLTEVELELMTILWNLTEATVHQVLEQLPDDRKLAYTSVSTILRILEEKKIIQSRKEKRAHIYFPLLPRKNYEEISLQHIVHRVFQGEPSQLVKQLVQSEQVSSSEINKIKKLIEAWEKK